jgi:hypothetical protein
MTVFTDNDWGAEDLRLLLAGHVHFVRHGWAVERLTSDLTTLGYGVVTINSGACADRNDLMATIVAAIPAWPAGYGVGNGKWDAFDDAFFDYAVNTATPKRLLIFGQFNRFATRDRESANVLACLLEHAGRLQVLFGRRLICLLQTDDPDLALDPVQVHHVAWNQYEKNLKYRTGETTPPWITCPDADDSGSV